MIKDCNESEETIHEDWQEMANADFRNEFEREFNKLMVIGVAAPLKELRCRNLTFFNELLDEFLLCVTTEVKEEKMQPTMEEIAKRSDKIFDDMFSVEDILKGDSIEMHKETWLLAKKELENE